MTRLWFENLIDEIPNKQCESTSAKEQKFILPEESSQRLGRCSDKPTLENHRIDMITIAIHVHPTQRV